MVSGFAGFVYATWFALVLTAGVTIELAQATEPPDLDNPEAYRGSLIRFGYPGNWEVQPTRATGKKMFGVRVIADQDAMVAFEICYSKALPEEDLALVVAGLRNQFRNWRYEYLASRWGALKGVGVKAIADIDDKPYRFTVLIVPLGPMRYMEIRQVTLLDHEEASESGFDLVKRSFKLSRRLLAE